MTPAARVQAAIEIIDEILHNGFRAELSLTTWSRKNRFAGSKDRTAIRDHVYGALRKLRSLSGKGGALSGRAILIAALREDGIDPTEIFTGARFAPVPLENKENATNQSLSLPEAFDIPDWLWPIWKDDCLLMNEPPGVQVALSSAPLALGAARLPVAFVDLSFAPLTLHLASGLLPTCHR